MKYIISEGRLQRIMNEYLDRFLMDKKVINTESTIIVYDMDKEYFTYLVGREELFTSDDFLDIFKPMFNLTSPRALKFISSWFENQFDVKVRASMSSV